MTALALSLVLSAAFVHASWNFLAKRVSGGGVAFVWLFGLLSALLYAPLAVATLIWQHPQIGWIQLGFMVGSGMIHAAYFLLLQQGYRLGDLSLVYPLARGTGPMLSTVAAIALFGERPTGVAIGGTILIAAGIILFTAQPAQPGKNRMSSIIYALLTGVCIAAYTLWDKYAVSQLAIPPLLEDWASNLTRAMLLTPLVLPQLGNVKQVWQSHRRDVISVAGLCPLSYILVLTALTFSPVSYVAPAREISIVIAAIMGTQWLAEGNAAHRLFAASLMVLGVMALAIG